MSNWNNLKNLQVRLDLFANRQTVALPKERQNPNEMEAISMSMSNQRIDF